jgi:PPE-repeat protein
VYNILESIAGISVVASSILSACMGCIGTVNGLVTQATAPQAALGSLAGGVNSGAGAMHSASLGASPAAMSARLGHGVSVGAMSVPPSWAAAAQPKGPGMAALPGTRLGATPIVAEGIPGMPGMPMATSAGRSGGEPAPRYGLRLTVMARPVVAG